MLCIRHFVEWNWVFGGLSVVSSENPEHLLPPVLGLLCSTLKFSVFGSDSKNMLIVVCEYGFIL